MQQSTKYHKQYRVIMFNKSDYLSKSLWLADDFLMKPDGSKRCKVCNELHYAIEFIDYIRFLDGKLPVCNKCLRSKLSGVLSRSVIDELGFTIECGKCGTVSRLGEMSMSYSSNKVSNFCKSCTKVIFKEAYIK